VQWPEGCGNEAQWLKSINPHYFIKHLQALRVVVVVLLLFARPRLSALGRSSVSFAATLSVKSLNGAIGLGGGRVLQALGVVVVLLQADEWLLTLGATGVVLSAALAVEGLGWAVWRN
jgi:hypothetical protein